MSLSADPEVSPTAPISGDPAIDRALGRDGWAVLPLLDAGEVATLARAFDTIVGVPAEPIYSSWPQPLPVRARTDAAIRAVVAPRLRARLPGWDVVFGGFMAKAASPETAFPIHQDPTIADEARGTPLTFWVPLVDVDPATGCMQGVPGSHRLPSWPRPAFRPFPYQHEDARLRPLLRPIPMRAGELLLASPALFHASTPNGGTGRRVAAVGMIVPAGTEVRYYHRRVDEPVIDVHPVPEGFYVRVRPDDATDALPVAGCVPDLPPTLDVDALKALATDASA